MKINKLDNQKFHLFVFFIILCGCIFLMLGRLYITKSAIGGDAVYYYSNLRSLAIDHDLIFRNEYEYFHNQISEFTENRKIPIIPDKNPLTDKFPAKYPIGTTLFLMPIFLFVQIILIIFQSFGLNVTTDGYNLIYQVSVALSSLIYAFLGLLIVYFLGRKIFNSELAFWGTLGIWLATPLIYYMTMEPLSSQPISFFCVSLFIYLWYRFREKSKYYHWIILGIIGGLISIVRYQDSLFLLIPIIDNARKLFPATLKIFLFLFFASLVISIQFLVNNYLYGSFFQTGYGEAGFPYLASPKIFYTLFSLQRGLFIWSPILIFAVIGLYYFSKVFRKVGIILFLSFLIQVYIVSSWADPTQGDSFGNRILLNSSLIFALGLMQFLKQQKKYQKMFLVIFTLFILLNSLLAGLFIFRIIGQPY